MYSIKHNTIYRQKEKIAEITSNGLVVFFDVKFEKYRLPVWNFLHDQKRITKNDNGQDLAIYFEDMEDMEEAEIIYKPTEATAVANEDFAIETSKLNIQTVRELMEIVEKMSGEAAPFMSQSLGDKTPEVWDYFKRNLAVIEIIKTQYNIDIKLDKLYK